MAKQCHYDDCVEQHPVADQDEQVTCATCRKELCLPPLQMQITRDGNGNDYEVPDTLAKEGFWLTVGKASVHIKDGDDGVSVSLYGLHHEMDDSLAEVWATHSELESEEDQ